MLEDGSYLISPRQAKVHRTSEGLALLFAVPVTLWAATRNRKLTKTEKLGLGAVAVGTLVVDGVLYRRYK